MWNQIVWSDEPWTRRCGHVLVMLEFLVWFQSVVTVGENRLSWTHNPKVVGVLAHFGGSVLAPECGTSADWYPLRLAIFQRQANPAPAINEVGHLAKRLSAFHFASGSWRCRECSGGRQWLARATHRLRNTSGFPPPLARRPRDLRVFHAESA